MTFEDELNALIYFHLEEHSSGRHLLQTLEEDDFARDIIAPKHGIQKSSFFEAINTRGLEQLLQIFQLLYAKAATTLPKEYEDLGNLMKKAQSLAVHMDKNKKDLHNKRNMQIIEARIHKLSRYYKREGVIAANWKYVPKIASVT